MKGEFSPREHAIERITLSKMILSSHDSVVANPVANPAESR
jgi:hypothetical protein